MNAWHLRNWLIQQPKPVKVRVTDENGEVKEILCAKRPIVRIAESIVAIGPDLIECLGPNDELLRAYRSSNEAEFTSTAAPPVPTSLAADPGAAQLGYFASLIHRAYEHSTELAFNKLIELVERMDQRSEAIERRLERAETAYRREQSERIDDLWERAEEVAANGGSKEKILETLLTSMMQGRAAQHPPKPNGGTQ